MPYMRVVCMPLVSYSTGIGKYVRTRCMVAFLSLYLLDKICASVPDFLCIRHVLAGRVRLGCYLVYQVLLVIEKRGYFCLNVDPRFLARTTAVVEGSALMTFRPQARRSTMSPRVQRP